MKGNVSNVMDTAISVCSAVKIGIELSESKKLYEFTDKNI